MTISDMPIFADLRAYRQSEENRENCRPFSDLCREYEHLYSRYADSFAELQAETAARIHRRAYAKDGACLHRGFYSPSRMDLVVGNLHRGRLLKRPPQNGRYTYEYQFDAMERLICTVKRDGDAGQQSNAEFLLYRPEHVLGLTFDAGGVLSFLSSCQYEDGEPARYETALFSTASGEPRCIELQREISVCEAGVLRILDWYRYAPDLHLEQMRYTFTRDTEGKLSTYTAEEILGFRAGCTPPREYRVRGKFR